MCIIYFEAHLENGREHFMDQYYCGHEDCNGRFESHQKHLIYTPRDQCSICIEEDKVNIGLATNTGRYNPPVSDLGPIQGENEDLHDQCNNRRDYKALSDVDSVTSHWRLDDLDDTLETKPEAQSSLHPHAAYGGNGPHTTHGESSYTGRYDHHRSSSPYIPWTSHPYYAPPPRNSAMTTSSSRDVPSNMQENTHQPLVGNQPAFNESLSRTSHREMVQEQLAQLPHHMAQVQQQNYHSQFQYYGEPSRNYQVWPGERTYGMGVPPNLWPALWPDVKRPFEPGAFDHLRSQMGNDEPKSK